MTKPVLAYIAGFSAPPGKTMGHAGAIISGSSGTAQAKKEALEARGIAVGTTPTEVAQLVAERAARFGARPAESLDSGHGHDLVRPRRPRARVPARSRSSPTARARRSSATARRSSPTAPAAATRRCASWIAERSRRRARAGCSSRTASLQGFVLLAQQLGARRRRVLVEAPTYDRPLKILRELGAEVVAGRRWTTRASIPTRSSTRSRRARRRRSSTRSRPSRTRAAARSPTSAAAGSSSSRAEHELLVLEDDPYGLVRFEGERAADALRARRRRRRRSTRSSFSKTIAPGLRVGWYIVSRRRSRRAASRRARRRRTSRPSLLGAGDGLRVHPPRAASSRTSSASTACSRRAATRCSGARASTCPDAHAGSQPEGGYFIWLELPDGTDAERRCSTRAEPASRSCRAPIFGGAGEHAARLAYSFVSPDEIGDGVARLAGALRGAPGAGVGGLAATAGSRRRSRPRALSRISQTQRDPRSREDEVQTRRPAVLEHERDRVRDEHDERDQPAVELRLPLLGNLAGVDGGAAPETHASKSTRLRARAAAAGRAAAAAAASSDPRRGAEGRARALARERAEPVRDGSSSRRRSVCWSFAHLSSRCLEMRAARPAGDPTGRPAAAQGVAARRKRAVSGSIPNAPKSAGF